MHFTRILPILLLSSLLGCSVATNPPRPTVTDEEQLRYLSSIGAPKSFTELAHDPVDLALLADGFRSGRFPRQFASQLITKPILAPTLKNHIEGLPEIKKRPETLRMEIAEELSTREHLPRRNTDYIELTSADEIESVHMLVQLRRFSAFFGRQSVIDQLPNAFFASGAGIETGGLVMWNKDRLEIFPVRSFDSAEERERLQIDEYAYYRIPRVIYYLPSAGLIHIHPKSGVDPREMSGPSCSCTADGRTLRTSAYGADTSVAESLSTINPYFMHLVVTEIDVGTYNVDAYFFDIIPDENNDPRVSNRVTVVDLGIFRTNVTRK